MNVEPSAHIPVLLHEVVAALAPAPGDNIVDCTAGLGGHASALAAHLTNQDASIPKANPGRFILCDHDPANLAAATARLEANKIDANAYMITSIPGSFAQIPRKLTESKTPANVVLADLGFASNQMQDPQRGFSFMRDGPLDMRLNPAAPVTAAELVNTLPARELADIIREFGEEPAAGRIAEKIVLSRKSGPIQTTSELAAIVRSAIHVKPGTKGSGIDPSTKTFQAIRIAVNDELGALGVLLESVRRAAAIASSGRQGMRGWLAPGARIGVISFHSLEDRMVKEAFKSLVQDGLAEHIGKPPITASEDEIQRNPRSRSAKFRAIRLLTR